MRPFAALAALALSASAPCAASETWAELLRHWVAGGAGRTPWTLVIDTGGLGERWWRRDDTLALLVEDRDLTVQNLTAETAGRFREARGWSAGPAWILLSRDGEVAGEGRGVPRGPEVRSALGSGGYQTVWDRREAFLGDHPDHGEALQARLFTALALARDRFLELAAQGKATAPRTGTSAQEPRQSPGKLFQFQPAPPPKAPAGPVAKAPASKPQAPGPVPAQAPPEPVPAQATPVDPSAQGPLADALFLETADTLERLLALPDWWRLPRLAAFSAALEAWDAGASPRLRGQLMGMRVAVLEEWRRNPHTGGNDLGVLWTQLERTVEGGGTPVLPPMDPTPGRGTPSREQIARMAAPYLAKGDWQGALRFLANLRLLLPAHPATPTLWREYTDRQAYASHLQALANAKLGRWKDAENALVEVWLGSGDGWPVLAGELQWHFPEDRPGPTEDFRFLLKQLPQPYPPVPPLNLPVRMLLCGGMPWSPAWGGLRYTPSLAAWDPGELLWQGATAEDQALLERMGLPGPRWAALQGETLVATGVRVPEAKVLAGQLTSAGTPRLTWLETFINHNPDHLDARRDRFLLIRPRLPNPALEPLLAGDAAAAWIDPALNKGAVWRPDPALWGPLAPAMTRDLAAALHRWPSSARLWKLWLAWGTLLPATPSVHAFALALPVYGPQGPWVAGLPVEAHTAVGLELRQDQAFEAMRGWFQTAWGQWQGVPLSAEDMEKADVVYRFLAEALGRLGLREALAELKAERAALRMAVKGPS